MHFLKCIFSEYIFKTNFPKQIKCVLERAFQNETFFDSFLLIFYDDDGVAAPTVMRYKKEEDKIILTSHPIVGGAGSKMRLQEVVASSIIWC